MAPARCEEPAAARTRERETQAAFLKVLIAYDDGEASLQLQDRLAKVHRESKRIRQVIFVMVALFILALCGLGYCALLRPRVFSDPTHFVTRSLSFVGLASLISQVQLFGYLVWQRVAAGRLHQECHRRVVLPVESQLRAFLHGRGNVQPGREH
jgi:hypothetical protein